jgi:hypothetical protein
VDAKRQWHEIIAGIASSSCIVAVALTHLPLAASAQALGSIELRASECVKLSVQLSERPRCLEDAASAASKEMVQKTNAFIGIASVSCAYNVYIEWQESLDTLAAVWRVIDTQVGGPTESGRFARLKRSIEMEILESRFAGADAALRNGGRFCRKYADAEYRRVLNDYRDPSFGFARDRAKVGIDDVRALPPIPE